MASPTQWTWVWVNSRSWWWTGRLGVLQSMGSQRVGYDWVTELNWSWDPISSFTNFPNKHPFVAKGFSSGSLAAFGSPISLVFTLEQFFCLSSTLLTLTLLRITGRLFLACLQFGFPWCFLMIRFRACIFDKDTSKVVMSVSVNPVRRLTILVCFINMNQLIKVISAKFLHCILWLGTLRLCKLSITPQTFTH